MIINEHNKILKYSFKTRNQVYIKDYGFQSFAKNMIKNTGKNIKKNLKSKYNKIALDPAKKSKN